MVKSIVEVQMQESNHSVPDGFHITLPEKVVTIGERKGKGSSSNVET